ncbi:MAG: hypothetical protein KDH20_02965 [Rhodocyclaceae bacterium]|nr:hypothetical protein [Rhodocyclaceae bacterium]
MRLQFFLPGLLWPGLQTQAPCEGLAVPALERLLGLASPALTAGGNAEAALTRLFGLEPDTSPATLRSLGQGVAPAAASRLCADPVGLRFTRDHLLLVDGESLEITDDEAGQLIAGLNDTFPDIGRFTAGDACRWYLDLPAEPNARFTALADVIGRPVAMYMPEGEDARHWHRLINETQVWLHAHPVNQAREAAGRQTINSLWPWGHGAPLAEATPPASRIIGDAPLLDGLLAAAGRERAPADAAEALAAGHDLLVCDDRAGRATRQLDLPGWQQALADLDTTWFAPALAALRTGRLASIELLAPGDRATLALRLARPRLWPFWKRPRPLIDLIQQQDRR